MARPDPLQRPAGAGAWLAALFALAAALRLAWAWGSLEDLLRYATSDDAYYYFQIAHHWIAGRGPSLDGETATNGFHPLWMALCTALAGVVSDPETLVQLGLSGLLAIHLGGACIALRATRGAGTAVRVVTAAAFASWLLLPSTKLSKVKVGLSRLATKLSPAATGTAFGADTATGTGCREPTSTTTSSGLEL